MSSNCSNAANDFVKPNCHNLANMGPGCFVRIEHGSACLWVEITEVENTGYKGKLHPELAEETKERFAQAKGAEVHVEPHQVNALGCDRYCYCD